MNLVDKILTRRWSDLLGTSWRRFMSRYAGSKRHAIA